LRNKTVEGGEEEEEEEEEKEEEEEEEEEEELELEETGELSGGRLSWQRELLCRCKDAGDNKGKASDANALS